MTERVVDAIQNAAQTGQFVMGKFLFQQLTRLFIAGEHGSDAV